MPKAPEALYPKVQTEYFTPTGGLDQVTPRLRLPPGFAIDALNFECDIDGGYRRIAGYDKFHHTTPLPSQLVYYEAVFDNAFTVVFTQFLRGITSGATATFVGWASVGSTGQSVYLADVQGQFVAGEQVWRCDSNGVMFAPAGIIGGPPTIISGANTKAHAQA